MAIKLSLIDTMAWPVAQLGEAIDVLARKRKLKFQTATTPISIPESASTDEKVLEEWLDSATTQLGIEAEAIDVLYNEIDHFLENGHPALVRLPEDLAADGPRFLLLFKSGWRKISLIGPDAKVHGVSRQLLRDVLTYGLERPIAIQTDITLNALGGSDHQSSLTVTALVHEIMLQEGLGTTRACMGWLLRLPPNVPLRRQARHEHLIPPLIIAISAVFLSQTLELASWGIIGLVVFQGYLDWAWFLAWFLILLSIVACRMVLYDQQFRFFTRFLKLFKEKLLYGTLRLKPDEIRQHGAGQFLSRIMDSEIVENVSLFQGVELITQLVQLVLIGIVLSFGVGGWGYSLLLLGWISLATFMSWRYLQVGKGWIHHYRQMSQDLVDRMVGHRTRIVQENAASWHDDEDQSLERYLQLSTSVDRLETLLLAFIPRGWSVVSVGLLAYLFIIDTPSPVILAISIGCILFAFEAFTTLTVSLMFLLRARLAQDQNKPIMHAAAQPLEAQELILSSKLIKREGEVARFLVGHELGFRYPNQRQLVLHSCSLQINLGEHLLLEGPSGSGKSTLAAILGGLYLPETGMLLMHGFDQQLLGSDTWRRHILVIPQFQDNYVFTETLGFNLLMGHRWPPLPEDLVEAETICRELGLGHLLDEMADGFDEQVGDSGWRLSHGERSRLYIARGLLQKPDLLILDESFGSLDPESLQITMECVLRRVPTLLVIAHP
ncbi:MAG: ABC transporter ATP-binding protein [Anaerolineae bacterium]|nr:ABC transporter ATP-binding protein [Anaerolineae bacterium]